MNCIIPSWKRKESRRIGTQGSWRWLRIWRIQITNQDGLLSQIAERGSENRFPARAVHKVLSLGTRVAWLSLEILRPARRTNTNNLLTILYREEVAVLLRAWNCTLYTRYLPANEVVDKSGAVFRQHSSSTLVTKRHRCLLGNLLYPFLGINLTNFNLSDSYPRLFTT